MLEKEVDILSRIRHRNVIEFYGVSEDKHNFIIVTEFAEGGSLFNYLRSTADIEISQIIEWAMQIATAVEYLHYGAPVSVIHRDLKSNNVVLRAQRVCKLCDFGLSKNLAGSRTAASFAGTIPWMSPGNITAATDVWSYGVVLWEMLTREVPYKDQANFFVMKSVTEKGSTLAIPEEYPPDFKRYDFTDDFLLILISSVNNLFGGNSQVRTLREFESDEDLSEALRLTGNDPLMSPVYNEVMARKRYSLKRLIISFDKEK
ncbi:unnamed protein product [Anisakis simplex]|uniref:Protein kinase domain-containing protein n=1 Tax=Anisakis simplex TaxID=6269 RepID=A0A0M3KEY6_ANISI|nr:unnamed protein product [Anisakis simplex]